VCGARHDGGDGVCRTPQYGEGLVSRTAAISLTAIPNAARLGLRGRGACAGAQSRPVLAALVRLQYGKAIPLLVITRLDRVIQ